MIPADTEPDLKALAKITANRRMELAALKEVQASYRLYSRRCDSARFEETVSCLRG